MLVFQSLGGQMSSLLFCKWKNRLLGVKWLVQGHDDGTRKQVQIFWQMPLAKKPSAAVSIYLQFCSSFLFILQTETRLILPKIPIHLIRKPVVTLHCYRIYPLTSFSAPFSFSRIGCPPPPTWKLNVSHSLLILPHSKSYSFSRLSLCSALIYVTSFIIHTTHFLLASKPSWLIGLVICDIVIFTDVYFSETLSLQV